MPADGHAGVRALTYHLLVLLDDHVGIRPQEDVKIQHPPDGPPGQARSRLQDHLLGGGRGRKEKKTVTIGEQPPDPDPHGGDQAAPQATLSPWQGNGEIPALCSVDAERASGGLNHHSPGRSLVHAGRELALLKICSSSPELPHSPSFHLKTKRMRCFPSHPPPKSPPK